MGKQIYINLPVVDLTRSTTFYEALGFTKNPMFSDEKASAMMWSDEIIVMLVTHGFYQQFIGNKTIADATQTNSALFALNLDSKEAVTQFAETAKANGGSYYQVDMGMPEDQMFGYEVLDPDGYHWEPLWMAPNFNPQEEK